MEKKETPIKQRKLKKIDEYMEKIPLAWRFYQREIERGTDPRKAELRGVKKIYPGDKNSSTTLRIWQEHGLWPPSEELLSSSIRSFAFALIVRDVHCRVPHYDNPVHFNTGDFGRKIGLRRGLESLLSQVVN